MGNSKNKVRGETMRQRDERIKRGGKRYLERLVRDKEAKEQIKDYKDEDRT